MIRVTITEVPVLYQNRNNILNENRAKRHVWITYCYPLHELKTKELLPSHHTPLVYMGTGLVHVDIPLQYDATTATKPTVNEHMINRQTFTLKGNDTDSVTVQGC